MSKTQAEPTRRGVVNVNRCGACHQQPYPTHALIDVQDEVTVVCANPSYCRERAQVLGIWCRP